MKVRKSWLPALALYFVKTVMAHSGKDTPGIELHHIPAWIWISLAMALALVIYWMYVETHDKPFNIFKW